LETVEFHFGSDKQCYTGRSANLSGHHLGCDELTVLVQEYPTVHNNSDKRDSPPTKPSFKNP
jgi:hypothetical protein